MAYLQLNNDNNPSRLVADDSDKSYWESKEFNISFVSITQDQFNKIQINRLYLPNCTDPNNIVWGEEITNSSTILGNDGNTYPVITDVTVEKLNGFVDSLVEDYNKVKQYFSDWSKISDMKNFADWLSAKKASNWSDVSLPISGKTTEEAIKDLYSGTFFSTIQV